MRNDKGWENYMQFISILRAHTKLNCGGFCLSPLLLCCSITILLLRGAEGGWLGSHSWRGARCSYFSRLFPQESAILCSSSGSTLELFAGWVLESIEGFLESFPPSRHEAIRMLFSGTTVDLIAGYVRFCWNQSVWPEI